MLNDMPVVQSLREIGEDGVKWFDARYVTDSSDTFANTAITVTAVGTQVIFIQLEDRPWRFVQIVTSANTNVTYRAELYQADRD